MLFTHQIRLGLAATKKQIDVFCAPVLGIKVLNNHENFAKQNKHR